MGGLSTEAGTPVRTGLLYRSGALDRLAGEDEAGFARLGIRAIYDLRTDAERSMRPDRVPPGARHVVANVLDDMEEDTPHHIMQALRDPAIANDVFGNGRGAAMFFGQYRGFVRFASARKAFGQVFAEIAREADRPALIHCTGGKDRTGWAAASLQLLLGVPMGAVMADFLASNVHLAPTFRPFFEDFEARGGRPGLLGDFFWVRPEYLEASLAEVRSLFGTIEGYFTSGLGLDADTLDDLREAFLAEG